MKRKAMQGLIFVYNAEVNAYSLILKLSYMADVVIFREPMLPRLVR
jgi:hypothetical protein